MMTVAIIVAGGRGKRMGRPKQFLEVCGKPVLEWTVSVFQKTLAIDEIILVVAKEFLPQAKQFRFSKLRQIVPAGKERSDSVSNGLKALPEKAGIVVIHDGARPLVSSAIIEKAVAEAKSSGAACVGVPAKDTLKAVSRKPLGFARGEPLAVSRTLDRSQIWQAQTPQAFKKEIILKAYQKGYNKYAATDDAALVERIGVPVKMVIGSYQNIKITTPDDLVVMQAFIERGK